MPATYHNSVQAEQASLFYLPREDRRADLHTPFLNHQFCHCELTLLRNEIAHCFAADFFTPLFCTTSLIILPSPIVSDAGFCI